MKKQQKKVRTDASTIRGVSCHPLTERHHQASKPPTVLARVKDGTLYIPFFFLLSSVYQGYALIPQREGEREEVRHTDRDGDAPRDEGLPASVRSHDAQGCGDGKQGAGADGPFPRHGREALAGDQPGREDPHEGGRDLEWVAGDLVYAVGGRISVRVCIRQTAGGD